MLKLCARTAQELLEEPITEADWVIEDLLPVGAHILAGSPQDRQVVDGARNGACREHGNTFLGLCGMSGERALSLP